MDNLIQKFYSNGKEEEQKYTQFGAFSNALLKNSPQNLKFKTTGLLNLSTVNPSFHNMETTSNPVPRTPNRATQITQDTFLQPKKLIFNSSSDLFNKSTLPSNNYSNNNEINSINNNPNKIPSLHNIKQNINLESKKNATKMQMMEEKMKNLELKSQRLEVINDFFFDMFENNLVKEELKRQKNIKDNKNSKTENNEVEYDNEEKKRKKKSKKGKKKDIDKDAKKQEELDILNFKKQTKKSAKNYLNNVKNDIGIFLVEEQLRKNEEIQNITEDLFDLKGELLNELERAQMAQNLQIKKIAHCLQNSGDEGIENLANRLFGDNILKSSQNTNVNSFNNTRLSGSVFNQRESFFNTKNSYMDKDNRTKVQNFLRKETKTIPEEKNENENEIEN